MELTPGSHFLRSGEDNGAIPVGHSSKGFADFLQKSGVFSLLAKEFWARILFGRIWGRRLVAVIHELVERHFERARNLFESLNCGDRVAVLDARQIAPQQPSPFFDVALRQALLVADGSDSFADIHARSITGCGTYFNQERFMLSLPSLRAILRRTDPGLRRWCDGIFSARGANHGRSEPRISATVQTG